MHKFIPYLGQHRTLGHTLYYASLAMALCVVAQAFLLGSNAAWPHVLFAVLAFVLWPLHLAYRMELDKAQMDELGDSLASFLSFSIPWFAMLVAMAGNYGLVGITYLAQADDGMYVAIGALALYGAFAAVCIMAMTVLASGMHRKTDTA